MTPAEHLASIPGPLQSELWSLTRVALGMDTADKEVTLAVFVWTAENLLRLTGGECVAAMRLMNAVGDVLRVADKLAELSEEPA